MALRQSTKSMARLSARVMQLGDPGSGAGRSGGGGGSIREAGGAFGKLEAAREGEFFHKLQQKQIEELKKHLKEELEHSQNQLEKTKQDLARHQARLSEIDAFEKSTK